MFNVHLIPFQLHSCKKTWMHVPISVNQLRISKMLKQKQYQSNMNLVCFETLYILHLRFENISQYKLAHLHLWVIHEDMFLCFKILKTALKASYGLPVQLKKDNRSLIDVLMWFTVEGYRSAIEFLMIVRVHSQNSYYHYNKI